MRICYQLYIEHDCCAWYMYYVLLSEILKGKVLIADISQVFEKLSSNVKYWCYSCRLSVVIWLYLDTFLKKKKNTNCSRSETCDERSPDTLSVACFGKLLSTMCIFNIMMSLH